MTSRSSPFSTALAARAGVMLLGLIAVFASPACGADVEPDFDDPDIQAVDTNPDGVPYPTDSLGGRERGRSRPGDRFPNFAFQGYRDGDRSAGLSTISMSELYDPLQVRNIKVIHLQVAATWCSICSSEIEATIGVKDALREEGVVFLEVIVSGKTAGRGPSLGEVDEWIDRHGSNITTAIDVRAKRLGALGIDPSAMPHDVLIDARTMEVLESSVGAPLDIVRYVRDALRWVDTHEPSY